LRLVAAAFLVAALAGCGGGGGGTPAERFAASGNAICNETAEKSGELQREKPPGYRAKLNAVGREGQRRLKALVPPPELRARRDQFFADLRELERIGANPGERPRAVALTNRLPVEARALGWTDCAG
jgi:hypothetical protein